MKIEITEKELLIIILLLILIIISQNMDWIEYITGMRNTYGG